MCFPCIQSFGFDYLYLVEPTLILFYSVFSKYFTNIVEDEGYCFNESLLTHTILGNSSLLKENKFPFLNYNFAKSPKKRYFVFWSSTLISKFPIYSKHYQAPPPPSVTLILLHTNFGTMDQLVISWCAIHGFTPFLLRWIWFLILLQSLSHEERHFILYLLFQSDNSLKMG